MRRWIPLVIVPLVGCSTAPIADTLDLFSPAPPLRNPQSGAPALPSFVMPAPSLNAGPISNKEVSPPPPLSNSYKGEKDVAPPPPPKW